MTLVMILFASAVKSKTLHFTFYSSTFLATDYIHVPVRNRNFQSVGSYHIHWEQLGTSSTNRTAESVDVSAS